MNLETFVKMRALQSAHQSGNPQLVDHILASEDGEEYRAKLKRLQFDTSPERFQEVESICHLLDCSKREFLDMAVRDALAKAGTIFFSTYEEVTGEEFGQPAEQKPC